MISGIQRKDITVSRILGINKKAWNVSLDKTVKHCKRIARIEVKWKRHHKATYFE